MAWHCPQCGSVNTRELWDNTGYGGDIKCDNCYHIWDDRRNNMPAPKDNINARKGELNRQMWSQRLPVDIHELIKEHDAKLEMSQADFVAALVRQYNNKIAAELQTTQSAEF